MSVSYENKSGLPHIYNNAITSSDSDILVFVHDDVWLEDIKIIDKISEGLSRYDIIGIAGNRQPANDKPSWFFSEFSEEKGFTRDDLKNLSGFIYHGNPGSATLSKFGPSPRKCSLIDGVFIAANRSTLIKKQVRFDPTFDFDFYDIDFCRTATKHGLTIGTWPIELIHQSGGNFGNPKWKANLQKYHKKWK